jgi:hypothetical protein
VYGLHKLKRIFIFNTLRKTLAELGSYSRKLDAMGEPTEQIEDKEKFHLMDAMRYIFSHLTSKSDYSQSTMLGEGRPIERLF